MARTSKNKEKTDNTTSTQESLSISSGLPADPGVDRIRDILFGGHIEQYEQRFQLLKNELDNSYQELKDSLQKQTEEIARNLEKKSEDLSNRIGQETEQRKAENKELSNDLSNASQLLTDRIKETTSDFTEKLNQIDVAKTDRKLLASLLRDLAEQLEKA